MLSDYIHLSKVRIKHPRSWSIPPRATKKVGSSPLTGEGHPSNTIDHATPPTVRSWPFCLRVSPKETTVAISLNNSQRLLNGECARVRFVSLPLSAGPHPVDMPEVAGLGVPEFGKWSSGEFARITPPNRTNLKKRHGLPIDFVVVVNLFLYLGRRPTDTPVADKMINSANFFDTERHTMPEIGLSMKRILSTAWVKRNSGNKRPAT